MKIKRFVALILCSLLLCLALAGCSESAGVDDYNWEPEVIVELEFDLYIITDSTPGEDSTSAMKTVNSKINQYIDDKYNTTVNIHYHTADEYDSVIANLVGASDVSSVSSEIFSPAGRQKGGSIILITSDEMHDYLVGQNKLVDLNPFLDTKDFGTLNIQLSSALIEAAKVGGESAEHLYCIPNDHTIGEYEYTVINRELAEGVLNFSAQTELNEMHINNGTPNDMAAELIESVNANLSILGVSSVEEVIRVEKGNYEDKAAFESQGYICNISAYPEATAEDAFSSAFGILKAEDIHYDGELLISASECERRAMEIVYAINADKTVRNLLQYGVENTHYTLEGDDFVVPFEDNPYKMSLIYTGDMFNAYYCSEWTKEMADNGNKQNMQSVVNSEE